MSTPSFIDRLRSRSRRPDRPALLDAAPAPLLQTSPGPLPEDHWHAGDPRLAPGDTALRTADVPSPRRPVDRRGLVVVPTAVDAPAPGPLPEVDLRADVVDLRGTAAGAAQAHPVRIQRPVHTERTELTEGAERAELTERPVHLGSDEPSTWWG